LASDNDETPGIYDRPGRPDHVFKLGPAHISGSVENVPYG
jgi:hypothetical protein